MPTEIEQAFISDFVQALSDQFHGMESAHEANQADAARAADVPSPNPPMVSAPAPTPARSPAALSPNPFDAVSDAAKPMTVDSPPRHNTPPEPPPRALKPIASIAAPPPETALTPEPVAAIATPTRGVAPAKSSPTPVAAPHPQKPRPPENLTLPPMPEPTTNFERELGGEAIAPRAAPKEKPKVQPDRRRFTRKNCKKELEVAVGFVRGQVPTAADFQTMECRNLSSHGCLLWTATKPVFKHCLVRLVTQNEEICVPASVAHMSATTDEGPPGYLIGCEFT